MSTDSPSGLPQQIETLSGLIPGRLVAAEHPLPLPAPVADERHETVRQQALFWQALSQDAWFWEMVSTAPVEGTAHALAGQMAAAGEQLALAYSAGVEVALWQAEPETGGFDVAREMSTRAMAEAQSLFVIGASHAFANIAVRALTLRDDLKSRLVEECARAGQVPTFDPFSEQQEDWLSLNKDTCTRLRKVAAASGSQNIAALMEPVVSYQRSQDWRVLFGRRGTDFHRWRPQTHGVAGVAKKTPWQHTPPRDGGPGERVLPLGQPVYEEARGLAADVAQVATDGMLALADAMERFLEAWMKASYELGGPEYKP